jgi:glycosyltransferase involved in cell wall biosynthesis
MILNTEIKINYLFFYTELAQYFLSCVEKLAESNCEIYIYHWPINKEAPFQFNQLPQNVHLIDREKLDIDFIKNEISPNVVFVGGWADKGYLSCIKKLHHQIPSVLLMDNQWKFSVKKILAVIFGRFFLNQLFSNIWVPGKVQYEYAKKLGFKEAQIKTGFYSADVSYFNAIYEENRQLKEKQFPKVFLYVGRYVKHKAIFEMWRAFIQFQEESPNDWELWCIGTGEEFDNKIVHPKIKHIGFVQPNQLGEYIKNAGVYILPSHFEPWGVALHEFATAGMPLLCSHHVGAASQFLIDNKNGCLFDSTKVEDIKQSFIKISSKNSKELNDMGVVSNQLAQLITPERWAETAKSFV